MKTLYISFLPAISKSKWIESGDRPRSRSHPGEEQLIALVISE